MPRDSQKASTLMPRMGASVTVRTPTARSRTAALTRGGSILATQLQQKIRNKTLSNCGRKLAFLSIGTRQSDVQSEAVRCLLTDWTAEYVSDASLYHLPALDPHPSVIPPASSVRLNASQSDATSVSSLQAPVPCRLCFGSSMSRSNIFTCTPVPSPLHLPLYHTE